MNCCYGSAVCVCVLECGVYVCVCVWCVCVCGVWVCVCVGGVCGVWVWGGCVGVCMCGVGVCVVCVCVCGVCMCVWCVCVCVCGVWVCVYVCVHAHAVCQIIVTFVCSRIVLRSWPERDKERKEYQCSSYTATDRQLISPNLVLSYPECRRCS